MVTVGRMKTSKIINLFSL